MIAMFEYISMIIRPLTSPTTPLQGMTKKRRRESSEWLSKFLRTKRDISAESLVPEICVSNDEFLRKFNENFAPVEPESEPESEPPELQREGRYLVEIPISSENELQNPDLAEDALVIHLYNLPYEIHTEEVSRFASSFGFTFASVELGIDKRTGKRSGQAVCNLLPDNSSANSLSAASSTVTNIATSRERNAALASACVTALQGEICYGRPVRAVRPGNDEPIQAYTMLSHFLIYFTMKSTFITTFITTFVTNTHPFQSRGEYPPPVVDTLATCQQNVDRAAL